MLRKKNNLFQNKKAVIATMHKKEQVIAPILQQELKLNIVIPNDFNTDLFGTFTNEIERAGDQLESARKKAEKALELTGLNIAISSEGSFGPHPFIPFMAINRELLLFIDKENDLEITSYVANTNTNFAHQEVRNYEEAYEFAVSKGFPTHGVIIKPYVHTTNSDEIIKGIVTEEELKEAVVYTLKKSPESFHMETDMRAMYNPTRMKNIEIATIDLVKKINTICPVCETPGFEIVERKKGLPCEICHYPTNTTLSIIYHCKKCNYQEEHLYPDKRQFGDAMYCDVCNP
ncbi:MAG: hypothetical protein LPK00_02960 [Bacillaceae bacterium]|nr:hypothetical protein [Bacillaceae bacterium]